MLQILILFSFHACSKVTDDAEIAQTTSSSAREIKRDELISRNRHIMNSFLNVIHCTDRNNLPFLCIETWKYLENIERGSLSQETKANSLNGRWFSKAKTEFKTKNIESDDIFIERDRIIICNATQFSTDADEKKKIVGKQMHRVLAVFTKAQNKWFMTADKQKWSRDMKPDELKKYRCAIRMITDGYVEDYDDVDLNSSDFQLNDLVRIISGLDIIDVQSSLFSY